MKIGNWILQQPNEALLFELDDRVEIRLVEIPWFE
jgi:hypothetical protein